tara:strand:- start:1831 stop:2979 length:1149 start_codon:yes stop_codon:yes gene_type:complete
MLLACGSDDSVEDFSNVQLETRKVYTGDTFVIAGANFSSIQDLEVRIDNVILPIQETTTNTVQVLIPSGATSGILMISANGDSQSFGNFVVFEERDTMYAFVEGTSCAESKIVRLATDTAVENETVYNFPETDCNRIKIYFFEKNSNNLVYGYRYFVTTLGEGETGVIYNLETRNTTEVVLLDGPDDPYPITPIQIRGSLLYSFQYRKEGWFRLYEWDMATQYPADEIMHVNFSDSSPSFYGQFYYNNSWQGNNILGYLSNPDTVESTFFRTQLFRNQTSDIAGVRGFIVDDQKGYVLKDNSDGTFSILRTRPYDNVISSEIYSFSATSASDLSLSKSTSRLFLRVTEGSNSEQYLYKIPLLEGDPSKTKIDNAIHKIFLDN